MISVQHVTKTYKTSEGIITTALKDMSIEFPDAGLVFILGKSGSGKSTLLNLLGALSTPDSGRIELNGIDIAELSEKARNEYRGKYVGFVFQSYNLFPQLTVTENILMGLNFTSIDKAERTKLVKEVLHKVGLSECANKKAGALSGGQSQRVAIARAIVRNPRIILADEPTGALDSENGERIMDMLYELSHDRLVVVVTHNEKLVAKYGQRTVYIDDGQVVSDNDGCKINELPSAKNTDTDIQIHSSCNFKNAIALAAHSLISKSMRSAIFVIASSIGILAACIIIAIGSSFNSFAGNLETSMLPTMPIVVGTEAYDLVDILNYSVGNEVGKFFDNGAYVADELSSLFKHIADESEITEEYLNYIGAMDKSLYARIVYDYGIDTTAHLYTDVTISGVTFTASVNHIHNLLGAYSDVASAVVSGLTVFNSFDPDSAAVAANYRCVYGEMPKSMNEVVLVLDKNGNIPDYAMALLGYYTSDEIIDYLSGEENVKREWLYEELAQKEFTYFFNDVVYTRDLETGLFRENTRFSRSLRPLAPADRSEGIALTVSGILRQTPDSVYETLTPGLYYVPDLIKAYLIDAKQSEIVQYMSENEAQHIDPFTGVEAVEQNYKQVFNKVGGGTLPCSLQIYAYSVEAKEGILNYLENWNVNNPENRIVYIDNVSSALNIVTSVVDAISIALLVIVALSCTVTFALILINTVQAVRNRRDEFVLLRCLGASKGFIAATVMLEMSIIGLIAGIFGIALSYAALGIASLTGIMINASSLSPVVAAALVVLNVSIITFIGCIPANKASNMI